MFENMNEQQAREEILKQVAAYCDKYHNTKKEFKEGDRIPYASRVYDSEEMVNLVDSSLEFWLTAGRYTDEFEREFSKYLGVRFCSLVNSGSSANLIAFMALEDALSDNTKAVMIAHTLGNPFDLESVKAFCDRHNLWLVEDNCDALGSVYEIDGSKKLTGTIGDIGTSSFYPPHHMTMGEGGAVYTNNPLLHRIVRSFRDWGRDCICPPGCDNFCGHRFDKQYGQLPLGYDHKYVYSHFGYNLKATDMQAAVGCAQLEKFPSFVKRRIYNFNRLYEKLQVVSDKLILPQATEHAVPSWFGFIVTCKEGVDRTKVVNYIESHGVQTRMLFSGNLIKHPCFDDIRGTEAYRVVGGLEQTDRIMTSTFWVGVYPGMTDEKIEYMAKVIHEALEG